MSYVISTALSLTGGLGCSARGQEVSLSLCVSLSMSLSLCLSPLCQLRCPLSSLEAASLGFLTWLLSPHYWKDYSVTR